MPAKPMADLPIRVARRRLLTHTAVAIAGAALQGTETVQPGRRPHAPRPESLVLRAGWLLRATDC